jgi:F-type H+-transporting ATPase subunit b
MNLPQLDVTSFVSQIFWLLLCVFSLLVFVKKIFLQRIFVIFDAREKRIYSDNERIREITESIQRLKDEYDLKIRQNKELAVQQRSAKLAELSAIRESKISNANKLFVRKRAALEKKCEIPMEVRESFVDILLQRNNV